MKKIALALVGTLLLAATVTMAYADTPAYRNSAIGLPSSHPTVTITALSGDVIVVCDVEDNHSVGDLSVRPTAPTDNLGGNYEPQYGGAWQYGSKWAQVSCMLRTSSIATSGSLTVDVTPSPHASARSIAVAVALTGISTPTGWWTEPLDCSMTPHFLRQANRGIFAAGGTPTVPHLSGCQMQPVLAANMTFAVLGNQSNPGGVTVPSGWTERQTGGSSSGGHLSISVATQDPGFTGSSVTWGSTSATAGQALILEAQ